MLISTILVISIFCMETIWGLHMLYKKEYVSGWAAIGIVVIQVFVYIITIYSHQIDAILSIDI